MNNNQGTSVAHKVFRFRCETECKVHTLGTIVLNKGMVLV